MTGNVCSFIVKFDRQTLNEGQLLQCARPFADVILGISTEKSDIELALRHSPQQLVPLTTTVELAVALSDAILKRSKVACSFSVSSQHIADFFDYAYTTVFGTSKATSIGVVYVSSMQRLLYNTAACTISHLSEECKDNNPSELLVVRLRNATKLLIEFASAVKAWLPNNSWLHGWSGCHALLCCIEFTVNTILLDQRALSTSLILRYFTDQIFSSVLKEEVDTGVEYILDISNSFGWCASSRRWRGVIYNPLCSSKSEFVNTSRLALRIQSAFEYAECTSIRVKKRKAFSRPASPVTM